MFLYVSLHPVSNLSQPGTFAGNDAIVAFARSEQLKVVIHQLNTPLWEVETEFENVFLNVICHYYVKSNIVTTI